MGAIVRFRKKSNKVARSLTNQLIGINRKQKLDRLLADGSVTYELLWAVFKPGMSLKVTDELSGETASTVSVVVNHSLTHTLESCTSYQILFWRECLSGSRRQITVSADTSRIHKESTQGTLLSIVLHGL